MSQPGTDTGRLTTALHPAAHRIVYRPYLAEASDPIGTELQATSEVDRAHLVMLTEQGILDRATARSLLRRISMLRESRFAALRDRPMPRGLYLAYEGHLVDVLGERVGGALHTGRSRNDLNATVLRLRVRSPYAEHLTEVERLARVLLDRAAAFRGVVMPAYTHGQPAVPITYGHYLTGVAAAVIRGLGDMLAAGTELDLSPLGAGAVGGTSVPVEPRRTAELLGFLAPTLNSVDAVASRDFVLRLLSAATVLGTTVARVAGDLSTWSTEEFGLVTIADDLVGSSSMMPQKRNPFLLEHIRGRATAGLGGFVSAVSAMVTAPFSNAIAVGTEAARHLLPGLHDAIDAVVLLRLVVEGTVPDAQRMTARAVDGFTAATYLAERMVLDGTPFRVAHHRIGRLVRHAIATGTPLCGALADEVAPADLCADLTVDLRPETVAAACRYGGGPADESAPAALARELDRIRNDAAARLDRWDAAGRRLDERVAHLTAGA